MPGVMSDEGDLLLTSLRPSRTLPSDPPGTQSLMAAMNRFVAAVEEMDDAIMIPCKLQDMYLDTPPCLPPPCVTTAVNHSAVNHSGVNHSAVNHSAVNHSGVNHSAVNHSAVNHSAVNHTDAGQTGHSQENGSNALVPLETSPLHQQQQDSATKGLNGYTNGTSHKAPSTDPKNTNLYTYYGMLRAIKAELVRGPSEDEDEEEEGEEGRTGSAKGEEDDVARQTATMFRHHLRGLFGVLRQMTGTAHVLTTKYQSEIGDSSLSSSRNLSHFTL